MPFDAAVRALRQAYPSQLPDDAAAATWAGRRRSLLADRVVDDGTAARAASSGCAVAGAGRHRAALAERAGRALARLDAGSLASCTGCGAPLPFDRLDALADVVTCAGCPGAAG